MFCDQGWKVLKAWCCYYSSSLTVSVVGKAKLLNAPRLLLKKSAK